MEAEPHTLILTRGAHSIGQAAAIEVRRALDAGEKTVEIDMELFSGRDATRRTSIVLAHVMGIAGPRESRLATDDAVEGNVRVLRPRNPR